MNHQHMTRNQAPKRSMVGKVLQCAFFAVVCIWLLYQLLGSLYLRAGMGCEYNERKLGERHIGKLLGRKGDAGSSRNAQDLELYGADLIGEAEKIRHVAHDGDFSNKSINVEEKHEEETTDNSGLEWRSTLEEFSEKEANAPKGESDDMLISEKLRDEDEVRKRGRTQVESIVSLGAVILKSEENGVIKRDSSPSRRSDIQVVSLLQGNTSSSGDGRRETRACEEICEHNSTKKQSPKKHQAKALDGKTTVKMVIESEKAGRRELLFTERWLNTTAF